MNRDTLQHDLLHDLYLSFKELLEQCRIAAFVSAEVKVVADDDLLQLRKVLLQLGYERCRVECTYLVKMIEGNGRIRIETALIPGSQIAAVSLDHHDHLRLGDQLLVREMESVERADCYAFDLIEYLHYANPCCSFADIIA